MVNALFAAYFAFFIIAMLFYFLRKTEHVDVQKNAKSGKIAVAIVSYKEEEQLLKETINSWKKSSYKLFLLRDSELSKEFLEFAKKNSITILLRTEPKNGKAGAINDFLERCEFEKIIIADADEKFFNSKGIEEMANANAEIVESRKTFQANGFLGEAMLYTNETFKIIEEFLSKKGLALFHGSLALMDAKTLKEIKFRPLILEDIDFSIRALEKGKKIKYMDCIIAIGKQPAFLSFLKQHLRYIYGTGEVIVQNLKCFAKIPIIFALLMILPLFSFFQSFVIYDSIMQNDFSFLLFELLLTAVPFFMYSKNSSILAYFAAFGINFILLPIPRATYFLLGLIGMRLKFKTTF